MWTEATRDESVRRSDGGGSEMWKRLYDCRIVTSSVTSSGTVRLGNGDAVLCMISVGKMFLYDSAANADAISGM